MAFFKKQKTRNFEKQEILRDYYNTLYNKLMSVLLRNTINNKPLLQTSFGWQALHELEYEMRRYNIHFKLNLQEEIDNIEWYKNRMSKIYYDTIEEYIPKVKELINNNLKDYSLLSENIPKFFVINSIYSPFCETQPFYCFSDELNYDINTNSFKGLIFTTSGVKTELSAFDTTIRKMANNEFENEFLPKRLRMLEINNEIEFIKYRDSMKKMFYNEK